MVLLGHLQSLGCQLSIMSYNIHGIGCEEESIILSELSRTRLARFFSPRRIFGYLRPVNMNDSSLFKKDNVHPVFINKEGSCDITCKVRAIDRFAKYLGLTASEVLFVDNSAMQTAVAREMLACHAFTVVDRTNVNSCITPADMRTILNFVMNEKPSDHLWFANSKGEVLRRPIPTKSDCGFSQRRPSESTKASRLSGSSRPSLSSDGGRATEGKDRRRTLRNGHSRPENHTLGG